VGNVATENILQWCAEKEIDLGLNQDAFAEAMIMAGEVFV
jgi:hypothetical protein